MNNQKIILILTFTYLFFAHPQLAYGCQNKSNYWTRGSLNREDLDRLKKEYRNTNIQINRDNTLDLWDVKRILGFSGEQIKTTNNGRVEHWIWVDSENCRRQVKAYFRDGDLIRVQSYGF